MTTQHGRVVDAFQPGRKFRPIVMREITVLRSRRDNQEIIGHVSIFGPYGLAGGVDAVDIGKNDGRVGLPAEHASDRRGDVGGRKPGRRDLVEQRLEQMIVVTIDHDHIDRRLRERLGGRQTRKTRADYDDASAAHRRLLHLVHHPDSPNCASPYRDEQGLRTLPAPRMRPRFRQAGPSESSREDERNPGRRALARQRPLSANVLGHSQYSSDEIVEGKRAWPPSHDAERHRGPRDMDRPTVGNGQLDNASHEEQPGRA